MVMGRVASAKPGATRREFEPLTLRQREEDAMSTRDDAIVDRDQLAAALVTDLVKRGNTCRAELPISHIDATGALSLWKVTVERVKELKFGAG